MGQRKIKSIFLGLFCLWSTAALAQEPKWQGNWNELLAGVSDTVGAKGRDTWLQSMRAWRTAERKRLQYSDSNYLRKELRWTRKVFVYAQMMAYDRYFYDPVAGRYTVDKFLNDLQRRYGGVDAVLIWGTYPNIGIDNRNQFDLMAAMPGGIAGLKKMVADFRRRGVRVFFPIMIWDHGTRRISLSMPEALVKEMKDIGADGMFGDTMSGVDEEFKLAYESQHYPLALQPELTIGDLKMLEWNPTSWGYYWQYARVPGVSTYKWMEPKHQVCLTNRWAVDKTDDLQYAFFNGIAYNAWENIWGIWNQVPERYALALRRISAIYRRFPDVWSAEDWEPHISTVQAGIFASRFSDGDHTVYTLVNRDSVDREGRQLRLPYKPGVEYYDLWNGTKLEPEKDSTASIYLRLSIEKRGFGAIAAVRSGQTAKDMSRPLEPFLAAMRKMAVKRLQEVSDEWKPLPQRIVDIPLIKAAKQGEVPSGMVRIPAARGYVFESKGVMIEGNELPDGLGVQHPWETHPARSQQHTMDISAFYMDKYPVTNQQFKTFMDATHYRPRDGHNFLKDWHNGVYPAGWDKKPVTWVSLEDARVYARWAGKRLPHEWEWQYAAQGMDRRLYPWGNAKDSSRMQAPDTARAMRAPGYVDEFPAGASPFGIIDMVGNVWQWTDEYVDEHTRAAILKGGSYFRAQSSFWYFPQAYEVNAYGKYLLLSPGMDRAGSVGFRCVKDEEF
ncbi:MAG: SUMF1/EgtB/PvdO family nonheme iron enzyme [Chitinophagaceae bacterium]|nr:SUMF1/EgtB/PvdO family nonheme iron enzyme [Chitinophagaceae bacterium]